MNDIMDWLTSNKEWLFSGAGIAIITVIGGLLLKRKKESSNFQRQRTNGEGQNIQAGGNVSITHNHGDSQKRDEMLRIASLEEIQRYDPRIRQLHENISENEGMYSVKQRSSVSYNYICIKWIVILLIVLVGVGIYVWLK